jgi:hypothetical protein
MSDHSPIKGILQRIARHKRGAYIHGVMHLGREWSIILSISTSVIVASTVWGFYLYQTHNSDFFVDTTVVVEVPYKSELVLSALEEFRSRRAAFEEGIATVVTDTEEIEADEEPVSPPAVGVPAAPADESFPVSDEEAEVPPTVRLE